MNRVARSQALLSLFLLSASSAARAQSIVRRPFTLDDLGRSRQPAAIATSPDGHRIAYTYDDTLWVSDVAGTRVQTHAVADGMRNQTNFARNFIAWSPDSRSIVFRRGMSGPHNQGVPSVADVMSGTVRPLLPDSLHRRLATFLQYYGGGPSWSPDGSRLAFLAADTMEDSGHLRLYVTEVATGATRLVASDTTMPFGGIASVAWSPTGEWLAYSSGGFASATGRIALLGATQGTPTVARVVVDTGATMYYDLAWSSDGRYLSFSGLNRSHRTRIEVGSSGFTAAPRMATLSDDAGWLWQMPVLYGTRADGMSARLALARVGALVPQLISGPDTLFHALAAAWDGTTRSVSFTAENGALPLDVWTAPIDGERGTLGQRTRVTKAAAWMDSVALAESRIVRWRGSGGDTLEAQLFLPPGSRASPAKRLPVIILPYGDYANQFPDMLNFISAGIELLASNGYAVLRPNTHDGRGPSAYGSLQLRETEALLDTLIAAGLVDSTRIGVIGHSHGGALAYYYLTHSARFCGVVAVNGWSDWSEIMDARHFGENAPAAALAAVSPIRNVGQARGMLLAVSGETDSQVLPHNARDMVAAMTRAGKAAELLAFGEEGHLIEKPVNVRTFWSTTLDFLARGCGPR